ncbi:MAG: IPT/TIG domain-containing protein [Deltaproteobacteria bacterium]|nr:IPT/TIG domain-containing protein [Deltaproteobacteria bacterium]
MNRSQHALAPRARAIGRFTTAVVLALFFAGAQLPACWSVTALVPPYGCPGEPVTIQGFGFGAEQAESTVTFGGVVAGEVSEWTDTSITVLVPPGVSPGAAAVTVKGVAAATPFRVIGCPLPGMAAERPRIDADGAGQTHIAFGQDSTLRYLAATEGTFGEPEEVDVFRSGGALDLAVGPSGEPQIVYDIPVALPWVFPYTYARYIRRAAGVWGPPAKLCGRASAFDPVTCQLDRVAVGPDDVPSLAWLTYDVRYTSRWVDRVELDGGTWVSDEIARGDFFDSIASVDAITDSSNRVWLAQVRPWLSGSPPYPSGTRVTLGNPPTAQVVETTSASSSTFSRPALAEGTHAIHLLWRRGSEIRASRADRATGLIAATEVVTTLPDGEKPQPIVTADPDGGDAALILWLQAGKVMGASFESESGSWSAPFVVASNAASTPDATTRRGRTEVVWLGAASDLRYATLP